MSKDFDKFMLDIFKKREVSITSELLAHRELEHVVREFIDVEGYNLSQNKRKFYIERIQKALDHNANVRAMNAKLSQNQAAIERAEDELTRESQKSLAL